MNECVPKGEPEIKAWIAASRARQEQLLDARTAISITGENHGWRGRRGLSRHLSATRVANRRRRARKGW